MYFTGPHLGMPTLKAALAGRTSPVNKGAHRLVDFLVRGRPKRNVFWKADAHELRCPDGRDPLQMANRHVAEQEALIARHRPLIRRPQEADQPDAPAPKMLTTMKRTLEVLRRDLERISWVG